MERFEEKSSLLRSYLLWVFGAAIVLLTSLSVAWEFYEIAFVPFAFLMIAWAFFHLNSLLLFTVAFTPLSVTLKDSNFNLGLSLPTEPILAGISFFLLLRFLQNGRLPWKVIKHPVSIALLFQIFWMAFCILTSEMPLVSFKAWISNLWFIIPLFFAMIPVFKSENARKRFLSCP